MSLKMPVPSDFCSSEIEEIILPEEVLIQIWTYLDFKTVQKTCTRVSKSWFEMIRNSKLSWEMKLRNTFYYPMDMFGLKDFNDMLLHWNSLRLLQFSSEQDFAKFHMCLNSHESLEKIVIPSTNGPAFYTKVSNSNRLWGYVMEYWIDPSALCTVPSHLLIRADTIKNVAKLRIDLKNLPEDLAMRQKDFDLTNLETIEINKNIIGPYENLTPKTELLFRFKNLKKLVIRTLIDMNYLLDILHFLGNTKNVKISVDLEVRTGYDEEEVEEIFQEALDIVNEKFPFPDVRILDLNISESDLWVFERQGKFSIRYGESGPIFTAFDDSSDSGDDHSDSELENSESMDEYLDEFVENSNSIDETVENSDTEDINVLEK